MSSGQIALSRLFSRPLLCSFRFLSPRSRLSVRCLVFKELFVAAVAATRSKFYFISFRLVKSFSKNFYFSFRSSHFRAIKRVVVRDSFFASRQTRLRIMKRLFQLVKHNLRFFECSSVCVLYVSDFEAFSIFVSPNLQLDSCFQTLVRHQNPPNHVHRLVEPAMQG